MSATLLSSLSEAISLVLGALIVVLLLGLVTLTASASFRSRKALRFEPWTDFGAMRAGEADSEVQRAADPPGQILAEPAGQRIADLLLIEIREIESVHQRSKRGLDLDNPYYDIPAFQQDLDDDLKLLAAATPQSQGQLLSDLVSLLIALVPVKPGRVQGSIHRTDKTVTLVAGIDNLRDRTPKVRQWQVDVAVDEEGDLRPQICEIAYKVYLELSTSSAFSGSEAFRRYTDGVRHHLAFGDSDRDEDRDSAVSCYEAAEVLEPNNPAVQYNLGVLKYYLYEPCANRQAIDLFRSALRSSEGRLKAQVLSGLCNAHAQSIHRFHGDLDDLDEARSYGERALRIDRDLDVALKALAFAYHQSSEALVRDGTGDLRAQSREARRYRNRAIHLYRRATRVNPRYYVAYNNLSNLYLNWAGLCRPRKKKNLLHLAAKLAEQSIEVKPSYHHAYDNVGNAYRALGTKKEQRWFDEAERYYEKAREEKGDYLEARHDRALLYLCPDWKQRDYTKALLLHNQTVADASDAAQADFKDEFVAAVRRIGVDAKDPSGATPRSILPREMLQDVTAGGRSTAQRETVATPG